MRKIFTLLTFSILAMAAMAVEITFDPAVDKGDFTGTTARAYNVSKDGITMAVSNGMIAPYKEVEAYRVYKGQSATFTSTIGEITKIEVQTQFRNDTTWGAGGFVAEVGTYTANPGEFAGYWTGAATTVKLTATAYQVRAMKIIVTVGDAGLLPPSFTPAGGTFYNPIQVTMSCSSAGAKIYYTTDGSTPTTSSTEYTAPLNLSTTTTLKAISALDGEISQVVTAVYTFTDAPQFGFGTMFDTPDNETVVFSHDATVIWQGGSNNNYLYAFDETGYGLIYGSVGQEYQIGDRIPAGFGGKKTTYKGEPELAAPLTGFQEAPDFIELTPEVITPSQVNHDHWAHYVLLKNVMISADGKTITYNGETCEMYNNTFNIPMPTDLSVPHDVYGVVAVFNAYQVLPISFDEPPKRKQEVIHDVRCINDLYALNKGDKGHFTEPLTAIYQSGPNLYIQDYDGHYTLAYGTVAYNEFVNGDYINDGVASWTTYSDNKQLAPVADTFVKAGHSAAVEPEIKPIEEVSQDDIHMYLGFENVEFVTEDDKIYAVDETGRILLYDKFGVMEGVDLTQMNYVEGFLTIYRGELEFYPIKFEGEDDDRGIKGDVNNDGEVTVADINALIDIIMGSPADANTMWRADVAEDGEIGIADINALVDMILNMP